MILYGAWHDYLLHAPVYFIKSYRLIVCGLLACEHRWAYIRKTERVRKYLETSIVYNCVAVGCSDLVSPSDGAWLRRDGNEVVVGCYTSRQSWQLRCVDGVWTGTVGLCPQHHYHTDTDQLQSSHSNTRYSLGQSGTIIVTDDRLPICIVLHFCSLYYSAF